MTVNDELQVSIPKLHGHFWHDMLDEHMRIIQKDYTMYQQRESAMRESVRKIQIYKCAFSDNEKVVNLIHLYIHHDYPIMALREVTEMNGENEFTMLIDRDGEGDLWKCTSTRLMYNVLENMWPKEERLKIQVDGESFVTLFDKPLGNIYLRGHYHDEQRHRQVDFSLELSPLLKRDMPDHFAEDDMDENQEEEEDLPSNPDTDIVPEIYERDILPNIRDHATLATLPTGTVFTVLGKAHRQKYGRSWLLVKLDNDTVYLAGDNLEGKEEQMTKTCQIKIVKKRTLNSRSNRRIAICDIAKPGDWASLVDLKSAQVLPPSNKRSKVRVIDVQTREERGCKRKLILTEDGQIYKLKKSRVEAAVKKHDEL